MPDTEVNVGAIVYFITNVDESRISAEYLGRKQHYTIKELRKIMKDMGMKSVHRMTKFELVLMLRDWKIENLENINRFRAILEPSSVKTQRMDALPTDSGIPQIGL